MSTLAFNNYRLAQFNQGSQVGAPQPAPQVQSPNTFNNAQQSASPTTSTQPASAPGVSTGNVTPEQKAAQQQEQAKQVLSTWFNTVMEVKQIIINIGRTGISLSRNPAVNNFFRNELPLLLKFEDIERWATNALTNKYDVIFNNLKSTNLGKIATSPEIAQLAQTLKDQMTRSIGRKLGVNGQEYLELLQKVKAAKAARPFNVLNSASKLDDLIVQVDNVLSTLSPQDLTKFQEIKNTLINQKNNLLNSTDAKSLSTTLTEIETYINRQKYFINRIDPKASTNIIRTVGNEAKPVNQALQMAAKFGNNPTAGRKAAVESINIFKSAVMKIPALRGLATALEFVGRNLPIIDMLISSADFAQFLYEVNQGKVKLDDPEHPEYIPLFIYSTFKLLLSISMVVAPPLIPILLPFDLAIVALQQYGPGAAEQLGIAFGGAGWGGKEKLDEMNRISEQAIGTPPSNPDAKVVYDWIIMKGFERSITEIVLKNPNANWNTFGNKWVQDAINNFFDNATDNYVDKAHSKILGGLDIIGRSWLKDTNDTRYQELKQSLLGLAMNIVKAARQQAVHNARPKKKTVYVPPFINYNKPTTSNTVYNNRRSVICPSI
jgi:hypothetical protein